MISSPLLGGAFAFSRRLIDTLLDVARLLAHLPNHTTGVGVKNAIAVDVSDVADRSAAYMGRWIAKNVVASGLADRCEVQFAYAIGHPEPVSVSVDTFCTGKVDEEKLERAIWEVFNFKPAEIIKQLDLLRPIYRKTTNYGHFGRVDDLDALTWERTDKADALKKAVK